MIALLIDVLIPMLANTAIMYTKYIYMYLLMRLPIVKL